MSKLKSCDLDKIQPGQIVLVEGQKEWEGYLFLAFFANYQFTQPAGPVAANMLSYETYGDHCVYRRIFHLPEGASAYADKESLKIGDAVLAYVGGYKNHSERNWEVVFYLGKENEMVKISNFYNPETEEYGRVKYCSKIGVIPQEILEVQQ